MRHRQGWTVLPALVWAAFVLGSELLPSAVRAGEWMLPDNRQGIRTAPLLLLSRPDVQADLQLDESQILGARQTINELTRRAQALKGRSGATVVSERRAIDEAQVDWLGKNLTGNQLVRLRQIELQWEGPAAMLSRPMVAEYLKLTAEQRQALARIIAERNGARVRGQSAPLPGRAFNQRAQSVLSRTQQELWTNLLGAPLRFASTSIPPKTRDEAARRAGHVREER